jgi:hypothetical protein
MSYASHVTQPTFDVATAFYLNGAFAVTVIIGMTVSRKMVPKDASWKDRFTFVWLVRTSLYNIKHDSSF